MGEGSHLWACFPGWQLQGKPPSLAGPKDCTLCAYNCWIPASGYKRRNYAFTDVTVTRQQWFLTLFLGGVHL